MMLTVSTAPALRREVGLWKAQWKTIALVPTMGALHDGHLALVRRAGEMAHRVVVSIFVNPTQFCPGEDLERYPRSPEEDGRLLDGAGCDLLFLPEVETIYPPGDCTFVEIAGPSLGLEGDQRPGHFRGVATVVARLFNLVQPEYAIFGEKDAQQLAVVRRLVRDLHFPVEIVSHPTVRDGDGIALSSRNRYLGAAERRAAQVVHRALRAAEALVTAGERRSAEVRRVLRETLRGEPLVRAIDYAEVVDAASFRPVERLAGRVVVPIAVRIGGTRLLDNLHFDLSSEAPRHRRDPLCFAPSEARGSDETLRPQPESGADPIHTDEDRP